MVAPDDPNLGHFLWAPYWQAAKPNGIEQLEDRGICADSQSKRSYRDERKPRAQPE